MYQPHLSRKFKLRCFRMEIDRKNGAILMSMVLEQIEKNIISKNRQNIQEKNGIDHNSNIVLSIFNIKKSFDINFF